MKSDILLEKIKKLLALSNSSNENEAKLAASKASELLIKYNLSMQEVMENRDYCINEKLDKKRISIEADLIGSILVRYFFVRAVYSSNQEGCRVLKIVGEKTNVEVAAYVYDFLKFKLRDLWRAYRRETGATRRERRSFYLGLANGLEEKLKATLKKNVQGKGLVLKRDPDLQKFMNENFQNLSARRDIRSVRDQRAFAHGQTRGRMINISRGVKSSSSQTGLRLGGGR